MNLNKYTKAELISKFKRLENKNNNSNQSTLTFSQLIINNLLIFKNLLLKFTIITLLYKTFKKYSIFRRIWLVLNTIVMTIFGISILDFYGISFIVGLFTEFKSILGNIINYLSNTQFYSILSSLFTSKEEIKQPTKVMGMGTINSQTTRNETSIERSGQINRWFNKQEVIEEDNNNSNKKYYIIAGLLILSCLVWYYYGDDIKPLPGLALEKLKNFRRRPDNNDGSVIPDNNDGNITPNNNTWTDTWNNFKNKFTRNQDSSDDSIFRFLNKSVNENKFKFNRFKKQEELKKQVGDRFNIKHFNKDGQEIGLVDNTQSITSSSSITNETDHYFKLVDNTQSIASTSRLIDKGKEIDTSNLSNQEINRRIENITSINNSENYFNNESDSILREIKHYLDYNSSKYCKEEIAHATYCKINNRLDNLKNTNKQLFDNLVLNNKKLYDKIEPFHSTIRDNWFVENPLLSPIAESNTYEEIAKATVQEQEAWSDRANSPSVHSQTVNSPIKQDQDNQSMLAPLIDALEDAGYNENQPIVETQPLVENQTSIQNQTIVENPPVQTIPKVKTSRASLWDAIKARRNDKDIIDDTKKELPTIEVNSNSSNNSMDNYFPESQSNIQPETSSSNIKVDEVQPIIETTQNIVNNPQVSQVGLTPILDKVKGLFTPKDNTKTLDNNPDTSNLYLDTNKLFDDIDDDLNINNSINSPIPSIFTDKIEFNILNDTNINIDFKNIWRVTKNIHLSTNEGHTITYSWDELGLSNVGFKYFQFDLSNKIPNILKDFPNVKIKEVIIEDLNNNFNSIYKL